MWLQWQMCGGLVRAGDDESESEIKVVYSQTSKPSSKALAQESEGGEGFKKRKFEPRIYKTPIRKKETSKESQPSVLI